MLESEGKDSQGSAQLISSPPFEFPVWKPEASLGGRNPFDPSSVNGSGTWPLLASCSMHLPHEEWDLATSSPWPSSDMVSEVSLQL